MRCLASSSPSDIRTASAISSSGVSRGTLPISLRYMRTGSSVAKESISASVSVISSSGTSSTSARSSTSGSTSSMGGSASSLPTSMSTPFCSSVS